MARKTLAQRSEVDLVLKAHNSQHSQNHRLQRGEKRLKVWNHRSPDHYCLACALNIIERDIAKLKELARQLRGETSITADVSEGHHPNEALANIPADSDV